MASQPDIFAYGEAQIAKKTKEMKLHGYQAIVHGAQREGRRRGIVVYYHNKHTHVITKEAGSKKFDILWIKMKSSEEERIFGFYYAPGAHIDEETRESFYDELRSGVERHEGKSIFLMGDSNARLGDYSGDKDIHVKTKTNKNMAMFLGFVQYSRMTYLNRIYAWGDPTYEILGQKKSIIDAALSNSLSQIKSFTVRPQILGASAQTCHKIITLMLNATVEENMRTTKKAKKFRHCSQESLLRVKGEVARNLKILRVIRGNKVPSFCNYKVLRKIY